ncbi:hypothetical protein TorRG33x02_051400 [Trema orientale]|uniref:Uncharacterized protein n=1 Tax=Trema orientale TaxID=63057 RepID=A0A2P5FMC9_TREOI|nr:hypothetical protein TorRG33x02_051400 [Trema orientale]
MLAKESGLSIDYLESDSLNVIQALARRDVFDEASPLLNDIRCLLVDISNVTCCFIPRNGNKASIETHPVGTTTYPRVHEFSLGPCGTTSGRKAFPRILRCDLESQDFPSGCETFLRFLRYTLESHTWVY